MLFDALFLGLFLAGWTVCGALAWLVWSVATRGAAGLGTLLLAILASVSGGLLVPFLGLRDDVGVGVSFAVGAGLALFVSGARVAARHRE